MGYHLSHCNKNILPVHYYHGQPLLPIHKYITVISTILIDLLIVRMVMNLQTN